MGGLMQCKQSHVTFLNKKCDMPPYVVGADGTYLCKYHVMEIAVERMWKHGRTNR